MSQQGPKQGQMSLHEIAQWVRRRCGLPTHDAYDRLEDVQDHVDERLQDVQTTRGVPLLPPVPPAAGADVPDKLPYTEDWDPDFDPRKGLLLLRPDGTRPENQDATS
ncbi:MAG: hypothetical protein O7G88_12455 [bacterium]|nr:hypothetical protein [bacterium]